MCIDCCPVEADAGVTCTNNQQCVTTATNSREYCAGAGCGSVGTCEPEPPMCMPDESPVCGCDGNTYTNACLAESAGVRVSFDGPCDSGGDGGVASDGGSGDAGGADCMTNSDCSNGDYCNGTTCTGAGACEVEPMICSDLIDLVCGCDGNTYDNPCEAASAGVRVASQGACGGGMPP
jgi:hypothetical protein